MIGVDVEAKNAGQSISEYSYRWARTYYENGDPRAEWAQRVSAEQSLACRRTLAHEPIPTVKQTLAEADENERTRAMTKALAIAA